MLLKTLTTFCFFFLLQPNEAYRILVFFPFGSKSHSILGHGVTTSLLEAGHEVVHITSFPKNKPVPNLTEINLDHIMKRLTKEAEENDTFKLKNMVGGGHSVDSFFLTYFVYNFHKQVLKDPDFVKLLSDPNETFDAVFLEWFFHDATAGLAPLLKCPLIWFGSTEAHWQILRLMDEVPNPAYSVDIFSLNSPPLGIWERVVQLWKQISKLAFMHAIVIPFEKFLYNGIFPELAAKRGVTMPSYDDAVYNGSLLLLNSHPSLGFPYKLPQNAKYIGGYHIDTKVKPLPDDLQKIMDEAKHGVIYFSMGSNLKSSGMSDAMKKSLLEMFSKLDQVVLWKFEEDSISDVPSNVKLLKWAPQQSILAHPNLKFFITHGGLLSTAEVVHFGVPIIGVPIMADQFINTKNVERKGLGIGVTFSENLSAQLFVAIRKMLADPSYKKRAVELSKIYHDRPVKPAKELSHWVEHVISTGGAPHLRSPALSVSWYQKMYLDVSAILLVIAFVIKKIWTSLCTNTTKTVKVKKN